MANFPAQNIFGIHPDRFPLLLSPFPLSPSLPSPSPPTQTSNDATLHGKNMELRVVRLE